MTDKEYLQEYDQANEDEQMNWWMVSKSIFRWYFVCRGLNFRTFKLFSIMEKGFNFSLKKALKQKTLKPLE